ncbi:GTPase Era [Candidatus Woesebacteria bacterium]|nr:GTPase Era [Candidatus Woesebacteria bacterium]
MDMKEGIVLLLGRPNVGKSTFVNNVIGQKVSITSPKPQTTRMPVQGLYEEERGKIIFTDTAGIFDKTKDAMAKKINTQTLQEVNKEADVVLYFIDPTRRRDFEEAKVLGIARKMKSPIVLVINKSDKTQKYWPQYKFFEDEFADRFHISALKAHGFEPLLDRLFEMLPDAGSESFIEAERVYPLMNMDSKAFIGELIREKVFIMMGEEVPYSTTAVVDEIKERDNGILYIKARILTTNDRHKMMLIGKEARKIKEIGSYARKEIALATSKKVFLDLTVETDPHWQEVFYS